MTQWTKRFSLEGRRALVTGASKGIGFETCRVLADAGADIAAVGRDEAGLAEVCEAVEALGRRCVPITADLATVEGPRAAARAALEAFGTIDILVNNAGVTTIKSIINTPVDDWEWVNNVNLRAPYLLAQALVPKMIEQRLGKVINISSQSGVVALDDHGAYGASKGGLKQLTQALALELAPMGIRVNAVAPGSIATNMTAQTRANAQAGAKFLDKVPLARHGEVADVVNAIHFLASDLAGYITGAMLPVDGGYLAI